MAKRIARGVFQTEAPVRIESYAAVVGEKEGKGPLGGCFDKVVSDSHFGRDTWEQAESQFQLEAVGLALRKAQDAHNAPDERDAHRDHGVDGAVDDALP